MVLWRGRSAWPLPKSPNNTRKTTPLMRFLEKWAVKIGGCDNYRTGLYDWIMIKDNHVDACGSHTEAISKVHQYLEEKNLRKSIGIEYENYQNEVQEIKFCYKKQMC